MADRNAQWLGALGRANEVRRSRAELKHELAAGTVSIVDVLTAPPAFTKTAKVKQLLQALPHIGPVRAGRLLTRCQIPEGKTVAGLTDRQRTALIEQVVALARARAGDASLPPRERSQPTG